MKFLFLEPFYGGSHRDFAQGLVEASSHEIDLATLPARFWKWRMRGAALHFIKKIPDLSAYDGIIATDLLSLSDFKALHPQKVPPCLVYFHENQITYPLAPGESMDFQFGFTDISTGLAADRILFNSRTHFNAFFDALPGFINMMPEYNPTWVTQAIREKSHVIQPGCRFSGGGLPLEAPQEPPLIIWNHRWEFDKNPESFFKALYSLDEKGVDFSAALMGENFQVQPKEFLWAKERIPHRIAVFGFVESREAYFDWLKKGLVIVSTANQENFGISVVEAMRSGCLPLLPDRLAYPEVLPDEFHAKYLYDGQEDLESRLEAMLSEPENYIQDRPLISSAMACHAWENRVLEFDRELTELAAFHDKE
ncbi:glycosyl transferase group 1 [Desulfatibacillum aliphaticivorans]|uniref:tRNA-queuosine alpha-mannosyltransferase n=1 Tax=Desulfatibacillum aliphaticivorans TaxID=218208 RepID=B8FEI3_DESAL|nr:DUF3524 domain-containing protein [Desulfatibacillum aliphaticivorans]ACL03387.1 glycosyl transferase group 1 [Desulfatibacillum aliphaticivorans]